MPSSTWKLHLSNTNKHFTLRSHEAKTWKTRWGLQNAFFGWQGGGARQNALLKVAAKQYLAILLKAWICFIFYALFSNVILMLYFDALFWYFILTLYFDTLFWHFILTLYFDALFWCFILTLYFDTLFWRFILTLYFDALIWRINLTL